MSKEKQTDPKPMSCADDEVVVLVTASQRVHYRQLVRMQKTEWEELKVLGRKAVEGDREAMSQLDFELEGWVDESDIYDADEIEDVEASRRDPANIHKELEGVSAAADPTVTLDGDDF